VRSNSDSTTSEPDRNNEVRYRKKEERKKERMKERKKERKRME
jgi:hypothetical protein